MIEVRKATVEDIPPIVANLRELELSVCRALEQEPMVVMLEQFNRSRVAFTALADGVPGCMFGGEQESVLGRASIWVICTPLIYKYPYTFLLESKRFVEEMKDQFGSIGGITYFDESCKWLEWLGLKRVKSMEYRGMQLHQYHL